MRQIVAITYTILVLTNSSVFSKSLGRFMGDLQIGKNPIVVTKEGFKTAANIHQKRSDHRTIRVLAMINSDFDPGAVTPYGWKYLSRISESIVELEGPAETAPYLTSLDGLLYAKMPSKFFSCMDSARKLTHVDEVQGSVPSNLPRAYKGEGVLVGIMETEFDTHHPAFLDSTGSTRFLAIWDQSDSTGPKSSYGYGTIKDHAQIDADPEFALHGVEVHGTWVAGLAAGSMLPSNPYHGVAPKASLIGVKYGQSDNDLVNGIKWIFSIADSLHMPCVINMSIGSEEGPHDGTSLIDRAIDNLSGNGKIIVGAAGNDGDRRAHIKFILKTNETKGTWITPTTYKDKDGKSQVVSGIDLWGKSGVYYSVNFYMLDLLTMNYRQLQPVFSTSTDKQYKDTLFWADSVKGSVDTIIFQAIAERRSALNNKVHVEAIFKGSNPNLIAGVTIRNPSSSVDTINAWNICKESFESYSLSGYFEGDSIMSVNEIGGTAKRNICVGAYISKLRLVLWDGSIKSDNENLIHLITPYSSHGPTADGRAKPDICAPGCKIVGPLNSTGTADNLVLWPDPQTKYGRYSYSEGTSLAAPIVTGVVALMLQIQPTLSPEEAKKILQQTAFTDEYTGNVTVTDNIWGAGKIDALKAIQTMVGVTGNSVAVKNEFDKVKLEFLAHTIKATGGLPSDFPCSVAWYSINGKLIKKQVVERDRIITYPEEASNQVCILKLKLQNAVKTVLLQKP